MKSHSKYLPVLLIGNSPNRLSRTGLSWPQLLQRLRDYVGLRKHGHETKPFTLHFEEMLSAHRRRVGDGPLKERDAGLRKYIADTMRQIKPNGVHHDLMNLPVEAVLTTNYDFSLERSVMPELKGDPPLDDWGTDERRYCLFLRRNAGNRFVFHIHGDIGKPGLLILGHEGYMESAARIRLFSLNEIADPHRTDTKKPNRIPNPGLWYNDVGFRKAKFRNRSAQIKQDEAHSWVDLFMLRDVHIVGLGLDFTESDLWYLISYKARLKYEADVHEDLKSTTIYFHYFADNAPGLSEKTEMLKCFGVVCIKHEIPVSKQNERDYEAAWKGLIEFLRKEFEMLGQTPRATLKTK